MEMELLVFHISYPYPFLLPNKPILFLFAPTPSSRNSSASFSPLRQVKGAYDSLLSQAPQATDPPACSECRRLDGSRWDGVKGVALSRTGAAVGLEEKGGSFGWRSAVTCGRS